jgi:Ion channel
MVERKTSVDSDVAGPAIGAAKAVRMRARDLGYGLVLLLVIASIALQLSLPSSDGSRFVTILLQAATLVAAVRVSGMLRTPLRVASVVAGLSVIAAVVTWIARGDIPAGPAAIVNGLLVIAAPVAIARGLLQDLRERSDVSASTLTGVLAIYLLAGMFFSFVYGLIAAIDTEALFTQTQVADRLDQLYFSFVTLCTVGYGDLTPAGNLARSFSVAEMLFGQIYLVTVVSLIVGNLTARRRS